VLTRKRDLDGLRGVAVLLVIFLHLVCRSGEFGDFRHGRLGLLLDSSWSGVDVFFVLSGFLIGGVIIDHGRAGNFLRIFYLRRTLRVVPLAWLTIAFSYLVLPLLNPSILWGTQTPVVAYLSFTNNFWTSIGRVPYGPLGPMWSLAIEEQFYLVAPMFLLAVGKPTRNVILTLVVLTSPCLRLSHLGFSAWDFSLCRMDGLACGILLAGLLRDPRFHQFAVRHRGAVGMITASLVGTTLYFTSSTRLSEADRIAFGVSLNSLSAAAVILCLQIKPDSWLSKALSRPEWVISGRYSYCLYLVHIPIACYVKAAISGLSPIGTLVTELSISFACVWASWRFLESKLIRLGKQYTYQTIPPARLETQVGGPCAQGSSLSASVVKRNARVAS
jgi:peptidoglycan/LPS O-acetylase OafA/YrhL